MVTREEKRKREEAKRNLLRDAGLTPPPDPFLRKAEPEPEISTTGSGPTIESTQATKPEIIFNDRGQAVGIRRPGKQTILGVSKDEVAGLAEKEGIQDLGQAATAEREAQRRGIRRRGAGVAEEVLAGLTPAERNELSPEQNFQIPTLLPGVGVDAGFIEKIPGIGIIPVTVLENLGIVPAITNLRLKQIAKYGGVEEGAIGSRNEITKAYENGALTLDERWAAMIENLRVSSIKTLDIGPTIAAASGTSTSPTEIVKVIDSAIGEKEQFISDLNTRLNAGTVDPTVALRRISQYNDEIDEAEARVILMIRNSAILRANPDQVDRLEDRFIKVRGRLEEAANNALIGITNPPTEIQIYETLRDVKQNGVL